MALERCLTFLLDNPPTTDDTIEPIVLAVYRLLDVNISEGVRCQLHDGEHVIPALITQHALNIYQSKRSKSWETLRRSRLVLRKYEFKCCVETCFAPYVLIAEFDSHGYPMKDKTDDLRDLKPTERWKARCRGDALAAFDQFRSDEFLGNVEWGSIRTTWDEPPPYSKTFPGGSNNNNNQNSNNINSNSTHNGPHTQGANSVEDDSWQATPMPYIHVDPSQNSQGGSSQMTVVEDWGETPVGHLHQQDTSPTQRNTQHDKQQQPQQKQPQAQLGEGPSTSSHQKQATNENINTTGLSLSTSSESEPDISLFPSPIDDHNQISLSPTVKSWIDNDLEKPSLNNLVLKRKTIPTDTTSSVGCILSTVKNMDKENCRKEAAVSQQTRISEPTNDQVSDTRTSKTDAVNSHSSVKSSRTGISDAGCKHNPAKKCVNCFLREPIVIPEYLFNQAKKNGFKCQCK